MRSLAMVNLAGAIIALVFLLARFLPPIAQAHYTVEDPYESWSGLTLHDPALRTVLTNVPGPQRRRVVMIVGDCGPCNASKVMGLSECHLPPGISRFVLVSENVPLAEAEQRFGHFANVVFSVMAPASKATWNVSFTPRVYAFDREGRLLYLQPPSLSYGQALYAAGEALNGKS